MQRSLCLTGSPFVSREQEEQTDPGAAEEDILGQTEKMTVRSKLKAMEIYALNKHIEEITREKYN